MNWSTLFNMQEKLDQHIVENHQLQGKNLLEDRYLALLVELGELANETRCFKFWSHKPAAERDKILEEYVDGVHFILSLGLEKGYRLEESLEEIPAAEAVSLTEQFNQVFAAVLDFRQAPSKAHYEQLFLSFLQLGQILEFTPEHIFKAYVDKNEVNFTRQREGY